MHHLFYQRNAEPWEYPDHSLITVCEVCHEGLHISRFGELLIGAAIVGGAEMNHLFGLMYAFESQFVDGPWQAPIPADRWENVVGGITYVLMAVKKGATERQLRKAIEGIQTA